MCDECEIIIDNRERDLLLYYKENVNSNKYYSKYKKENLDLGDIIYKINNKIVLIIERKTLDDLHKSIKDGRYREQKKRIIHSLSNKVRKIYLLEGSLSKSTINKKTLDGVINNTIVRDNIHIYLSNNINKTIEFIDNVYIKLNKFFNIVNDDINNEKRDISYEDTCFISKKKNITKEVCYINQYQQIPAVSSNIAKIIYERYGNLHQLYSEYNLNNCDKFLFELSNLKYGKTNRRIGPKKAGKICEYLFLM